MTAPEASLRALAARRWRISIALTAVMMLTYFGFLFLVAWAKSLAATRVGPGLTLGIVLGALVIGVAWIVTGIYVFWANRVYDRELRALKDRT